MLSVTALEEVPEVVPGQDLLGLIDATVRHRGLELQPGDILAIAHKVVSKAEGRIRSLPTVKPSARAVELAGRLAKDPRLVQVILEESRQLLRAERGVLICLTHHGFVCANAGVDASNVPGQDSVVLLPVDPDASARALRRGLHELTGIAPGVVITDSFGRAWRHGQSEVAIGCAGLAPLEDWRGRTDALGGELKATWIGVADELAGAADLARAKDTGQPIVLIRGAGRHVIPEDGPGAAALIRPESEDLFR